MKIFKYILFLILIIIIGTAVYFGTKDGAYNVGVTKIIKAPKSLLFEEVNTLSNWKEWDPWSQKDPDMKVSYGTVLNGEGASFSWESDMEGDGSIRTLKVIENDTIFQDIIFETPFGESKGSLYWYFNPSEEKTTSVTWGISGNHSFIDKIFLTFQKEPFEQSLEAMFEKGLQKMETRVNDAMNQYSITIEGIKEYGGGYYLYTTTACKINEFENKMPQLLRKVVDFAELNNIPSSGRPFAIYSDWDKLNSNVIFSVAIPVKERIIITQGDVLCGYMEPLSAVKTTLKGNYHYLVKAYEETERYIVQTNLVQNPMQNQFEVYTNNAEDIPNPANWITEIYIPVKRELMN